MTTAPYSTTTKVLMGGVLLNLFGMALNHYQKNKKKKYWNRQLAIRYQHATRAYIADGKYMVTLEYKNSDGSAYVIQDEVTVDEWNFISKKFWR